MLSTQKAVSERPKLPAAPPLAPDEIQKLVNPLSKNCKHCGVAHTPVNFIFYTESPSIKGWFCFKCWGYHYMNRRLPDLAPARVLPKRLTNAQPTA
jgi:hypothetical protein